MIIYGVKKSVSNLLIVFFYLIKKELICNFCDFFADSIIHSWNNALVYAQKDLRQLFENFLWLRKSARDQKFLFCSQIEASSLLLTANSIFNKR